ncbi:uncharacterized protein RBU57_007797 isoform 2-T2 [Macrochelys suwanniensis]
MVSCRHTNATVWESRGLEPCNLLKMERGLGASQPTNHTAAGIGGTGASRRENEWWQEPYKKRLWRFQPSSPKLNVRKQEMVRFRGPDEVLSGAGLKKSQRMLRMLREVLLKVLEEACSVSCNINFISTEGRRSPNTTERWQS